MKILLFYHSLISDWNHGNAHFLRGITAELLDRGHQVEVYEPKDNWSLSNLRQSHGEAAIKDFYATFPKLHTNFYEPGKLALDKVLKDADMVIVHEWNDHDLVKQISERRKLYNFRLFFHDTHHRSVSQPEGMSSYDLGNYDGVLAYGRVIRNIYIENRWAKKAWTWHEAADTRIFKPIESAQKEGDVVWIGNWGDDERTEELFEFLINPVKELGLKAKIYGVRYPETALKALEEAGIEYGGWLPNHRVPEVFSKYRLTVHVPRRYYTNSLPGIPTIRPFEALSCGIPMISAPWKDDEHLFTPGKDFLFARDGEEMKKKMQWLLNNPLKAKELAQRGLETLRSRHTCAHRVDELLAIYNELVSTEQGHLVAVTKKGAGL